MQSYVCNKLSEVERALIILSNEYDQVLSIINDLISRNGYLVEQSGPQKIKDIYFDTRDEILKEQKTALRLRTIDDKIFKIALKISKNEKGDESERVEIEKGWSQESFIEIMNELNSRLGARMFKFWNYNDNPEIALTGANFQQIQERRTERNIINALNSGSHQIEFEFAIDRTLYHLDPTCKQYGLMELEIESKQSDNHKVMDRLANELITRHPSTFKLWPHSKIATGKAMETLLSYHELKKDLDYDDENLLTPLGIEKIDSLIRSSRE